MVYMDPGVGVGIDTFIWKGKVDGPWRNKNTTRLLSGQGINRCASCPNAFLIWFHSVSKLPWSICSSARQLNQVSPWNSMLENWLLRTCQSLHPGSCSVEAWSMSTLNKTLVKSSGRGWRWRRRRCVSVSRRLNQLVRYKIRKEKEVCEIWSEDQINTQSRSTHSQFLLLFVCIK